MDGKTAAILLAAGRSERMGTCKQLLPLGDRTVIARCVGTLLDGGVDDVVVVINAQGEEVVRALNGLPVRITLNGDPGSDMAGSIRAGLRALPGNHPVFVALADIPLVSSATIGLMIDAAGQNGGSVIVPFHRGRKGHPNLFPRHILEEMHALPTLRELMARHSSRMLPLEVDDTGILMDMDTPEEYRQVRAEYERITAGR